MTDPSFDVSVAGRWFAVETNNATWDWLYANTSGDPADPIVHVAHASYHHWSSVGTTINMARAASLLANVHATLGNARMALAFAQVCLEQTDAAGEDAKDWDLAFAQDSLARALAAGADLGAAEQKQIARAAGDAISDPGDKEVFDEWFAQGNWHNLS